MKKIIDVITSVMLILVIVFAFLLVGVRIFGVAPYTVLSGSMEPTYHTGSLIYVKKANVDDIKLDDPITYKLSNGTVVTHRIIEIVTDPDNPLSVAYRTKGDANNTVDGELVTPDRIIGKPVFHIPLLGYVSVFIRTPQGIAAAIALIATMIILAFIPDLIAAVSVKETAAGSGEDISSLSEDIERLAQRIKELEGKSADASDENPDASDKE